MAGTESLSEHEAYLAMYAFLAAHYARAPSDELGALLGSLSILPNGGTADPAMAHDWQEACRAARTGEVDATLRLSS